MIATSTALTIAAAVSVAGAGLSAYGMYAQGQSQKKMADYNAKVAENSAIASRQQSEFEATRIRDRARRIQGSQVTAFSKSGLMLSGSAVDVANDSSIQSEIDALTTMYKGNMTGNSYQDEANATRWQGNEASSLGKIGAGATVLGGLSEGAGYLSQASSAKKLSGYQPKIV
jgi:hypothetical protein